MLQKTSGSLIPIKNSAKNLLNTLLKFLDWPILVSLRCLLQTIICLLVCARLRAASSPYARKVKRNFTVCELFRFYDPSVRKLHFAVFNLADVPSSSLALYS